MSYTLTKVLHVTAVAVWLAGMFWQSWILKSVPLRRGDKRLERAFRVDELIVLQAMVLALALGFCVAFRGHWFGAHWLALKLVLVVSLSGLCVAQSVALRRRAQGDDRWANGLVRFARSGTLVAASSAIALAFLKPF